MENRQAQAQDSPPSGGNKWDEYVLLFDPVSRIFLQVFRLDSEESLFCSSLVETNAYVELVNS